MGVFARVLVMLVLEARQGSATCCIVLLRSRLLARFANGGSSMACRSVAATCHVLSHVIVGFLTHHVVLSDCTSFCSRDAAPTGTPCGLVAQAHHLVALSDSVLWWSPCQIAPASVLEMLVQLGHHVGWWHEPITSWHSRTFWWRRELQVQCFGMG